MPAESHKQCLNDSPYVSFQTANDPQTKKFFFSCSLLLLLLLFVFYLFINLFLLRQQNKKILMLSVCAFIVFDFQDLKFTPKILIDFSWEIEFS